MRAFRCWPGVRSASEPHRLAAEDPGFVGTSGPDPGVPVLAETHRGTRRQRPDRCRNRHRRVHARRPGRGAAGHLRDRRRSGHVVGLSQSRRARAVADCVRAASEVRPLLPNDESWLAFTDLVFVDPPGTGQGRLVANDGKTKERVWSVDGDVNLLADAIASWLRKHDRVGATKTLVGAELWRPARAAHRRKAASPARAVVSCADPGVADPGLRLALSCALVAGLVHDAAAIVRGRAHGAGGRIRSEGARRGPGLCARPSSTIICEGRATGTRCSAW